MPRRLFPPVCALIGIFLSVGSARALTNEALLDSLQRTACMYFWNEANPANGLIKDRSTSTSPASIAAVGFGLSAICVGIDHGWIDHDAGRQRVLTTLNTFWTQPQGSGASGYIGYKGLFYHFLDMTSATRTWSCEVSTIDTALLFAGIIDAKQYFSSNDPLDLQVRALADSITTRADWEFFRNYNPGILMGWKPGTGFGGFGQWIGYNEGMIIYLLALGSPTHPVPASTWSAWTSGYQWQTQYGYTFVTFPPLFGHQYSHCWVDFRYIQDTYMQSHLTTYAENTLRATLAQRAYCAANPGGFAGYGPDLWGLTACDGPSPTGYNARGAPPAQDDDGTIAPTAAGGSIAFAPEVCLAALQNMYNSYAPQLWSVYGFKDAFNLTRGWWDTDYLGIDEGPIAIMIENYRTQGVWNRVMANADIQRGLQRAGFVPVSGVTQGEEPPVAGLLDQNSPNPFRHSTAIRFALPAPGRVTLLVTDVAGRVVSRMSEGEQGAGAHVVSFDAAGLPSGVYFYHLQYQDQFVRRQCVLIK